MKQFHSLSEAKDYKRFSKDCRGSSSAGDFSRVSFLDSVTQVAKERINSLGDAARQRLIIPSQRFATPSEPLSLFAGWCGGPLKREAACTCGLRASDPEPSPTIRLEFGYRVSTAKRGFDPSPIRSFRAKCFVSCPLDEWRHGLSVPAGATTWTSVNQKGRDFQSGSLTTRAAALERRKEGL